MSAEIDPMVALVESWDTFLVPSAAISKQNDGTCPPPHNVYDSELVASLPPVACRTFLSDACPPLSSLDDSSGRPLSGVSPPGATDSAPSLLWLLKLVSRNVELLRAAAHLILQFNAQFSVLLDANERSMDDLRERHQEQLASLLEVGDSHATASMIVDSTVTERVVHQQEEELDRLENECKAAERQLELQLQETLFTFLNTSAPDAVAAANRKEDSLSWVTSGSSSAGDGLYRAEVDVSRFAEVRKPTLRNVHQSTSAIAPFSPLCLVPVRTIRLNNEVGDASVNSLNSPMRRRAKDTMLQPIILDVSPLCGLTRCLTCCSGTQPGAVSSSVSSAAEAHLLRLAHTRHSVLLLIGSEAAALEMIAACKSPELLLGAAHTCREGFAPLPHHPLLRVLFTTRLWGANVILLWNPSQEPRSSSAFSSSSLSVAAAAAQTVVEDALELAYAWDADMFSVAVLDGARLPPPPSTDAAAAQAAAPAAAPASASASFAPPPPSSPAAAFFAAQAMSMEVLRQLRNGVTRELLETAGTRRARCWQGASSSWLQLGGGSATTAGTHMCPRAVGALYASQAAAAAAAAAAGAADASSLVSSPTASSPTASSPTVPFRGPPVTFNTPLAIRAFLPLPEEYFIKEQARRRDADVNHNVGLGGSGGAAAAPAFDLEDSVEDREADFLHSSFTVSSVPRSARGGLGDLQGGNSINSGGRGGGGATYAAENGYNGISSPPFLRERQREAMGLESLIHYAFGEFAEML